VFNLFSKHCPICGIDVNKEMSIKRYGKYFCSKDHVQDFVKMMKDKEQENRNGYRGGSSGGCC
jgi:YHS domain-containing protein